MTNNSDNNELISLAAEIVSSYVSNNNVPISDVSSFIREVFQSLNEQVNSQSSLAEEKAEPAVPIKKSVTPDFIICLEDGKKFKSLKRHLRTHYDLSPEEYRAKWGLPADYPMVAPRYAEARSELAKQMGLGKRGKKS